MRSAGRPRFPHLGSPGKLNRRVWLFPGQIKPSPERADFLITFFHFSRAVSPSPLRGVCQSSRHSLGGEVRKKKNPFADLPPPLTTLSLQELRAESFSRSRSAWRPAGTLHAGPSTPIPLGVCRVGAPAEALRAACVLSANLVLALGVLGCLLPLFSPVNHRTVLSALAPPGRRGGVRQV